MTTVGARIELLEAAEAAFRSDHPRYAETAVIDGLRVSDFARLDRGGHVYLDYTGGGLHAVSQIEAHTDLLRTSVLGNPHSNNPTSLATTALVQRARERVHEFFRAPPEDYLCIFTANASNASSSPGPATIDRPSGQPCSVAIGRLTAGRPAWPAIDPRVSAAS